jgi:hypothetical protein
MLRLAEKGQRKRLGHVGEKPQGCEDSALRYKVWAGIAASRFSWKILLRCESESKTLALPSRRYL